MNINGHIDNYGYFGWNFDISCFYAIGEPETECSPDDPNYPTGIGVYQWTESRAPEKLDLNSQLEHSVYEINNRINGGKTVWERVENTNYSVDEYTRIFALFFRAIESTFSELKVRVTLCPSNEI